MGIVDIKKYIAAFLVPAFLSAQTLPNAVPMPQPETQQFFFNGLVLAGAYLCSFQAGTTTPQATYTDSTAGTPNTNPIVLDSNGRASVWIGPQLYKFILYSGGNGACPGSGTVIWSQDQVADTALYFANYVKTVGTATLINFVCTFTGCVSRTVASKEADIVSVKDFGAMGNGTNDDTTAINTAIANLPQGSILLFPCDSGGGQFYKITAPMTFPTGQVQLTLRGTDSRGCYIKLQSTSTQIAAFNLNGSDSVTFENLKLYADGSGSFATPQTVLLLGRNNSSNAAGHHKFLNVGVGGYANTSLVYSIASEENSWIEPEFTLNGGSAVQLFHTSATDDANICGGGTNCVSASNLSLWMIHPHFYFLAASGSSASSAAIYEQTSSNAGNHVYRDGYIGMLSGGHGCAVWVVADPANPFSGYDYEVSNIRAENSDCFAHFAKGVQTDGFITGWRLDHNTSSNQHGNLFFGENHSHLVGCYMAYNETENGGNPATSFDYMDQGDVSEDYTSVFTIRTIMTNTRVDYRGSFNPVITSASYNNTFSAHNSSLSWGSQIINQGTLMNGPTWFPPVNTSLSGQPSAIFMCGSDPTVGQNGGLWCSNADTRPYWDLNGKRQFMLVSYNTLTDLCGNGAGGSGTCPGAYSFPGAFSLDANGRVIRQPGGSTTTSLSSCGTGASVNGNDNFGDLVPGSGAITSCTITFGHTWNGVACSFVFANGQSTAAAGSSTNSLTFTTGSTIGSSVGVYQCNGI